MQSKAQSEALNVSAKEGRVLIAGPGLAVTRDIEAASASSDQLLGRCKSALRQSLDAPGRLPGRARPRPDRTRVDPSPVSASYVLELVSGVPEYEKRCDGRAGPAHQDHYH
jgi:hypothetical protein